MNDTAVKPRLAARRGCFQGFAMNIGTAVSIKAAAAITVRMTPTLVRKSRSDIGPSLFSAIRGGRTSTATDECLIFLSGSPNAVGVTDNERVRGALDYVLAGKVNDHRAVDRKVYLH